MLFRLGTLLMALAALGAIMLALTSTARANEIRNAKLGYGYGYGYGYGNGEPIHLTAESGASAIQLDWNASGNARTQSYKVFRGMADTGGLDWVATVTDTFYFDGDSALAPGADYCYQVREVPNGNTSDIACARIGRVELWVPGTRGAPGSLASVPINIRNAHQLRIAAANFWLDFDPRVIEVVSVTRASLTRQYGWSYSIQTTGVYSRARIAAVNLNPPVLYGEGALFWLHVRVVGTSGMSTALDLREYMTGGGTSIYVPGAEPWMPLRMVPLTMEDGSFDVGGQYVLGDVDGNSGVDAADAYAVLCSVIRRCNPTWEQRMAADTNGNGKADTGDAAMILYYATFGWWPENATNGQPHPIVLDLGNVRGNPGEVVETVLTAQDLLDWAGGELVVAFDPDLIQEVVSVQTSGLAGDFALQWSQTRGQLRVALAGGASVSGSDELIRLRVRIPILAKGGEHGSLTLADATLSDSAGRDFATSELQIPIIRENGEIDIQMQVFVPILVGP